MGRWLVAPFFVVLCCFTPMVRGQEVDRTGAFSVAFTERSPLSAIPDVGKRMGWTADMMKRSKSGNNPLELEYELRDESFEVVVPESYRREEPWGLFVFISPGATGRIHRKEWLEVLEKHKLIAIGPNRAGNNRAVWIRMGLALDAAHNMNQRYTLDERRIYVGGLSGGGRTSSFLGICFPDVFQGGFYMIGCNIYKQLPSVEQPGKYFAKAFTAPPGRLFTLAKQRSRHVLLTGDTDGNREQTKVNFDAMVKDGFAHATYFQVPEMGHEAPDGEWFEKGIVELDNVPVEAATRAAGSTRAASVTGKAAVADPAQSLLGVAKMYVASGMHGEARERLNRVVREHPGSDAAKEAERVLKEIEGK